MSDEAMLPAGIRKLILPGIICCAAVCDAAESPHWSFQPVMDFVPPRVRNDTWPRSEIDRFILARLEQENLQPGADADRRTLIRRAYFALVGLPPSPQEIAAFLSDSAPDAFERLVDRLLASPHFGERWGRHWLDVARFAQSTGGGRSLLYGTAWRYRDYVIRSFNQDKPFDRFIVEQLAGDLMPRETTEQARDQLIATAFLALGPTNYELQDKEQLRMDVIDEQIDTMGRAFLGMTLGCARCHDHKFDPVPTRDYYALAGIFRSTKTLIHANVSTWVTRPLPDEMVRQWKKEIDDLEARLETRKAELAALREELNVAAACSIDDEDDAVELVGKWTQSSSVKPFVGEAYRYATSGDAMARYCFELDQPGPYEVSISYAPHANRTREALVAIEHRDGTGEIRIDQRERPSSGTFEPLGVYEFNGQATVTIRNGASGGTVIADAIRLAPVTGRQHGALADLQAKVDVLESRVAEKKDAVDEATDRAIAVREEEAPDDYHVCVRGNVHDLGEMVPRGFLSAVPIEQEDEYRIEPNTSGRLELARWIASADNPLTARVIVNRVWHHLFGAGLVRTVDNFGTTGEGPSHPELLDYLASRFVEDGWRIKPLIHRVMLSRTWQLTSELRASSAHNERRTRKLKDPDNRLLSRQNLRRLDAEALYDSILSLSGHLDARLGGPTVREGTSSEYGYEFDVGRRAMYLPVFRNRLHGLFAVFDFPDPNLSAGRRSVSTLPTQALYLMNNPFILEQARRAADRLLAEQIGSEDARISRLYERGLGRPPTEEEFRVAKAFLAGTDQMDDNGRRARWAQLCQAIIACIDFRYVR